MPCTSRSALRPASCVGCSAVFDAQAQRAQLVAALARANGYANTVLAAMGEVPRELFLPADQRAQAYLDAPQPIGDGQTISQPAIVAQMLSALGVGPADRVLEVGTGSGYQAAVLARMGCEVHTLEVRAELHAGAARAWQAANVVGIHSRVDDARKGWSEAAPFAGIVVSCAAPRVPDVLLEQLAENAFLVMPVGPKGGVQQLERWQRRGEAYRQETLGAVQFVPWVSARQLAQLQAAAPPA